MRCDVIFKGINKLISEYAEIIGDNAARAFIMSGREINLFAASVANIYIGMLKHQAVAHDILPVQNECHH